MQIEKNKKAAEEVHIASKKDFLQNFSKSQVTPPENEPHISNGNGNHTSSDEVQIMTSNNSSSASAPEMPSKRHSVCTMEKRNDHVENNEVRRNFFFHDYFYFTYFFKLNRSSMHFDASFKRMASDL